MSIVKTGSGTQTFSAPQSYTSLAVNGGAMVLGGTNTLGTQALNNGSLTLAANTSLTLTAHTGGPANVKALVVNGNGPSSLSIAANSQIDLTNNAAVFHGTTQAAVNALLFSGQYSGPNGYWDGPGINSSSAANDPNGVTTLGVIDNAEFGFTDFAGVHNLDGTEILVKYTYFGDTDLNGVVNVADFSQFVIGLTHQGPAEWLNGDFDNNGVVNVADFSLFVNGLVGQTGQLRPDDTGLMTQEIDQMAAQVGIDPGSLGSSTVDASGGADAGRAVVPEPGSIGLLAVGALGLLGRRRRR
jgi:autotransporter-associated beta strand protein